MSRTSVIPDLIDALVTQATAALPEVSVTDGEATTSDLKDYLMVGVEDATQAVTTGAESDQSWPLATPTGRDEEGGVWCAAFTTGTTTKEARDRAFAIAGAVQTLLRSDTRLGIPGMKLTSYGQQRFSQWQASYGPAALLLFNISFKARI